MKVRAKFTVTRVAELGDWNGKRSEIQEEMTGADGKPTGHYKSTGIPIREITLSAVYDNGIDAENASFAKATPSGTINFHLNNPELADEFRPGQVYYVDFTPAQ